MDQAELISRTEMLSMVATLVAANVGVLFTGTVALIRKIGKIDKMESDINALWACQRAQLEIKRELPK